MDRLPDVEKHIINELLLNQKKDRRWKNIRFFLGFILIMMALAYFTGIFNFFRSSTPYVSLVRLSGTIMPGGRYSADKMIPILKRAFKDKKSRGVILQINSGGGTPVQSMMIHDQLVALQKSTGKKCIVVGDDMLASGAYMIASGAQKIYLKPDTIAGSIGVIMAGFGLSDTIKKYGVERRVFTAGAFKGRMDMFKPVTPEDDKKIKSILSQVHKNFINVVKVGRKGRLKGDPKKLFSGDFWIGAEAVKLGLADGIGDIYTVMKKEFKVKKFRRYSRGLGTVTRLLTHLHLNVKFDPMGSGVQVRF
jgi:protease-4